MIYVAKLHAAPPQRRNLLYLHVGQGAVGAVTILQTSLITGALSQKLYRESRFTRSLGGLRISGPGMGGLRIEIDGPGRAMGGGRVHVRHATT